MAVFKRSERSMFQWLVGEWRRGPGPVRESEVRRLERKHRDAAVAAENWANLLRDMEHRGQTSEGRYEQYFQAYIDAQRQLKRAELELFNVRHLQG